MNHLKIEQGVNFADTEIVTNSIISKLYKVVSEGLDESSNLKGRLSVLHAYEDEVSYLTENYPNLEIIVEGGYYIKFVDPAVENILKNAGIGDGVGISRADAAEVQYNTIKDLFKNNTEITSFDELQYFTSVTKLPSFQDCTNLVSVSFANITEIPGNAFLRAGIKTVNAPKLIYLGGSAFANSAVEEVLDLGNPTFGTQGGFYHQFLNCKQLRKVVLPETLSILIGIAGCSNIEEINFPESLTTVDEAALAGSCVANTVAYFKNVTRVGFGSFGKTCGIRYLYLPKVTETPIGSYGDFHWCQGFMKATAYSSTHPLHNVLYFKDISSFGACSFMFGRLINLVINNTTPPILTPQESPKEGEESMNSDIFYRNDDVTSIYVPDSAVSTYQSAPGFENVSSKIKPLSEMAKVATRVEFDALSESEKVNTLIEEYM